MDIPLDKDPATRHGERAAATSRCPGVRRLRPRGLATGRLPAPGPGPRTGACLTRRPSGRADELSAVRPGFEG
ncbi:hypothetical protein SAMN05443573_10257 [Celeribacter indicus]|nr:hypothetical protein SAMN05443573_10257 [Celeribacter indicus]